MKVDRQHIPAKQTEVESNMYCYLMTECEGQNRNILGSSSVQHFLPIFIFLFYPTTGR